MRLSLQRDRLRSFTRSFVSRFLAVFILSSFAVTLLPISTSAEKSMPCCAGKSSEHCDSGLNKPKPRPVITEKMCGLTSIGVTPIAVTSPSNKVTVANDSPAVDSASVARECKMDCGACATGASRHKRQKSFVQTRVAYQAPATVSTRFNNPVSFYSSNENWTRINPRGPPAVL